MKRLTVLLILLAGALPLFAKVRGTVVHAENSAVYPGVEVTLQHANGQKYVAYTDNEGAFYLNAPAGNGKLIVHSARETKDVPVQVQSANADLGKISVR
jgi:Carboxypeptidase regulatory-like domain